MSNSTMMKMEERDSKKEKAAGILNYKFIIEFYTDHNITWVRFSLSIPVCIPTVMLLDWWSVLYPPPLLFRVMKFFLLHRVFCFSFNAGHGFLEFDSLFVSVSPVWFSWRWEGVMHSKKEWRRKAFFIFFFFFFLVFLLLFSRLTPNVRS